MNTLYATVFAFLFSAVEPGGRIGVQPPPVPPAMPPSVKVIGYFWQHLLRVITYDS